MGMKTPQDAELFKYMVLSAEAAAGIDLALRAGDHPMAAMFRQMEEDATRGLTGLEGGFDGRIPND